MVCSTPLRRAIGLASLAVIAMVAPHAAPAIAADRLPDLGMAHPSELTIDTNTLEGHRLLRYTAVMANVGDGPFEVRGDRNSTSEPMTVTQRIYDDSATGYHHVNPTARMFYAGDGHSHWHIRDLEIGELIRLDNGSKVGTLAKRGFCLIDNTEYRLTLAGAPESSVYSRCGRQSSLHIVMGISVGWGDKYPWNIAYQYIDVTGLANGRYRLQTTVNTRQLGFVESNYLNNSSWVKIRLRQQRATILSYGPAI